MRVTGVKQGGWSPLKDDLNQWLQVDLSLPGYSHLLSGLGTGAWCAEIQDLNQYLQVQYRMSTDQSKC